MGGINGGTLSEEDRRMYEKEFSSILVSYASLTVGEEIGQGLFTLFSVMLPYTNEWNVVDIIT